MLLLMTDDERVKTDCFESLGRGKKGRWADDKNVVIGYRGAIWSQTAKQFCK